MLSCKGRLFATVLLPLLLIPPGRVPLDFLIVPGKSVGPLKLGMNASEVQAVWGTPSRTHRVSPIVNAFEYSPRHTTLYFNAGKVYEIAIYSSAYATKEGVRVGGRITTLINVYGRPDCQKQVTGPPASEASGPQVPVDTLTYRQLGLVIVGAKNLVRAILVSIGPQC